MIPWQDFKKEVAAKLKRDIGGNQAQEEAIQAPLNQSLFIIAGPGSGKTTVLALKVLKLIFVDGVDPSTILATTFTRKAAAELRSRVLGWGDQLRQGFINTFPHNTVELERLDFNQIVTGTLDSIIEEALRDQRAPGVPPPVVIEDFVANALMVRVGLLESERYRDTDLKAYIKALKGSGRDPNVSEMGEVLREVRERFCHDLVDVDQLKQSKSSCRGCLVACAAIEDYNQALDERLLYDYPRLEQEFLRRLGDGGLGDSFERLKVVLIDEYQDTNLLQEKIYFELAKMAIKNGGGITVVGDDDQSLFRFRGATVDLFQAFRDRFMESTGVKPDSMVLSQNYRSTRVIVDFVNTFACLDPKYQLARVSGKKRLRPSRSLPYTNYPVLGMFRDTLDDLARDLARFIHRVIYDRFELKDRAGNSYMIQLNPSGTAGDIVVLCDTPQEYNSSGNPRLPLLLRKELARLSPPVSVFNPRGQDLEKISEVKRLCGLILECIDPGSQEQGSLWLPHEVVGVFEEWREEARNFIESNPNPQKPRSLRDFVTAWQSRTPSDGGKALQRIEVPLVDLVYKVLTWIPEMQDDVEGLVYLEAVTRTITQSALFSNFRGNLIFEANNPTGELGRASVREALRHIFMPLAAGAIRVNEDLLDTAPGNRVNIMSIHQAKGLEFPLVIVDVGSDFSRNSHSQRPRRFPLNGGKEHRLEDELRPFSPLFPRPGTTRDARDRAFDDLVRKYFVAYSRAQDILMLTGLNSVKEGRVRSVAVGWDRDESKTLDEAWYWKPNLPNLLHI